MKRARISFWFSRFCHSFKCVSCIHQSIQVHQVPKMEVYTYPFQAVLGRRGFLYIGRIHSAYIVRIPPFIGTWTCWWCVVISNWIRVACHPDLLKLRALRQAPSPFTILKSINSWKKLGDKFIPPLMGNPFLKGHTNLYYEVDDPSQP